MDGTRPKMVGEIRLVPQEDIIAHSLNWLTKNNKFKDDPEHAEAYNMMWMKFIRRIKDHITTNKNLVQLYEWLKITEYGNKEIKDILFRNLEVEGRKRKILYFLNDIEVESMIDEVFNSKDEQLDLNKQN